MVPLQHLITSKSTALYVSHSNKTLCCLHNLKQANGEDAPPAYGSSTPSYGSPIGDAVTPNTRNNPSGSRPNTDFGSIPQPSSSTTGAAALNATNTAPTNGDDTKAQLAQARDQNQALKSQVEEQGLKQRKTDAVNQDSRERITTGTTGMGIQQQPADGVPVQIVAALCLLSFLLAYFLF